MTEEDEVNNTVDATAEKKQDDENHNEDSDDELFPLPPHTGMITMILWIEREMMKLEVAFLSGSGFCLEDRDCA